MQQPTNLFRILFKNTGTLNLMNLDMQAITKELNYMTASMFAAQETNVNWDVDSMQQLVTQCRRSSPQIKIATATSKEKSSDWYKPGGTLLLALNQWTSRVVKYGNDQHLGRWSYLKFVGKNEKRLIILSGYRVCNQQFDAASQTVTAQQIRLLQAQGVANPKPRKLFLSDLIRQVKQWRQTGHEVIICMDANDNIDDPKADISRLFQETDMMDLHHHRYPGAQKPATQQRGSHAIDLIAGSPGVADALVHAWICPFGYPAVIKGDHRMLGVDLDPAILFGSATTLPAHLTTRGVISKHPQKVTKFCKRVVTRCNQHQLAARIQSLQTLPQLDGTQLKELEAIDMCLTKILLEANKHCTPPQTDPWSPELNQAYLRHHLWSLTLSAHCNQHDMTDILQSIRARLLPSPEDAAESNHSPSANLHRAQKQL